MNIGSLNRRVKILRFVEQRDEYGATSGEWQEIAKAWAKIEQNGGSEGYINDQNRAKQNIKITLRYNAELLVYDRISYNNRIFEIESISDHATGHYMTEIVCTEKVGHGI